MSFHLSLLFLFIVIYIKFTESFQDPLCLFFQASFQASFSGIVGKACGSKSSQDAVNKAAARREVTRLTEELTALRMQDLRNLFAKATAETKKRRAIQEKILVSRFSVILH